MRGVLVLLISLVVDVFCRLGLRVGDVFRELVFLIVGGMIGFWSNRG